MNTKCSWIQTLRQPKIFNMAIFDWVMTLLGAFLLAKYIYKKVNLYRFLLVSGGLILLAIITHWVFGIDTMLNYYLGISPKPIRTKC